MSEPTKKDVYGRTRIQWALAWVLWWGGVAVAVFLGYQLSRPLWDAKALIKEKQQSCEKVGMVMAQEKVKFGTNYYCIKKGKNE